MDRLWAPWRKAYIRPEGRRKGGCILCRLQTSSNDTQNYVLKRTPFSFAVLNLYPYNNGHLMIVPKRHTSSLGALTPAERLDFFALWDEMTRVLHKELKPHGFNIGMNLGRVAGAGIPQHLHLHIVPRWTGDSNFMTPIAGMRVISESLDSAYESLRRSLKGTKKKSKGVRS